MRGQRSLSLPLQLAHFASGRSFVLTIGVAVTALLAACSREKPAPRRKLSAAEASNLVRRTPEFRAGILTMRVPRAIAVEPKLGTNMAPRFASTMGREAYTDGELQALVPVLVLMRRDSLLSIHDSPISETYESASSNIFVARGNTQSLVTPEHQRSNRYWRHYLAITPTNEVSEDWIAESGQDEVDESLDATRVLRTPGWRAVLARREVAGIAQITEANDTVTVRYHWKWQPTQLGVPFVSDSAAADPLAAQGVPKISRGMFKDEARFLRAPGGWTRLDSTLVSDPVSSTP